MGHYNKRDYSEVLPETAEIRLGHEDAHTPCPASRSNVSFRVTHSNGIHSTLVRFCECPNAKDRITQLMRARLFPGTTLNPKSAFTFDVLKEFSMLNLQSKCGAFDYMKSLRRLTDNVSTHTVPVSTTLHLADADQPPGSIQTSPSSSAHLGIPDPQKENRPMP